MTPEQKRRRIEEIEKDVHQIMMQLHHVEFKVDEFLQPRPRILKPVSLPSLKMPKFLKMAWDGFLIEMKKSR